MPVSQGDQVIGRCYTWRSGSCSEGVWRVVCRWGSRPGVKVIRNVKVERVIPCTLGVKLPGQRMIEAPFLLPTGEWTIRPWYPAPRRVEFRGDELPKLIPADDEGWSSS